MRSVHAGTRPGWRLAGEDALSPVIGEMLMIVLALLLVSLFSLSLAGLLPSGRDPMIDVAHNESTDGKTVYLWHKGGDFVDTSDLRILIIRGRETISVSPSSPGFYLSDDKGTTGSRTFGLGGNIRLDLAEFDPAVTLEKGDIIRLVAPHSVIFSGTANPGS